MQTVRKILRNMKFVFLALYVAAAAAAIMGDGELVGKAPVDKRNSKPACRLTVPHSILSPA